MGYLGMDVIPEEDHPVAGGWLRGPEQTGKGCVAAVNVTYGEGAHSLG